MAFVDLKCNFDARLCFVWLFATDKIACRCGFFQYQTHLDTSSIGEMSVTQACFNNRTFISPAFCISLRLNGFVPHAYD